MTIYQNRNGSYTVSTMTKTAYVWQTYYGYSKREAKALFREYLKTRLDNRNDQE